MTAPVEVNGKTYDEGTRIGLTLQDDGVHRVGGDSLAACGAGRVRMVSDLHADEPPPGWIEPPCSRCFPKENR